MTSIPTGEQGGDSATVPNRPARVIDVDGQEAARDYSLAFDFGQETRVIQPQQFLDEAVVAELSRAVEAADRTIVSPVRTILDLTERQQDGFLALVARAEGRIRVRVESHTEPADQFDGSSIRTPAGAAEAFLEYLNGDSNGEHQDGDDDAEQQGHGDTGLPRLIYFQDEFHVCEETLWRRIDEKNLKAQVVRFLQSQVPSRITDSFANSAVTNIKEITLLPLWHEPMPFWIVSQDPPEIEHPRLISFQNGLLDLDPAFSGSRPRLLTHCLRYFSTVAVPYEYVPGAECPLWHQTLAEIFPRHSEGDRRIEVLQEFLGLTLISGDTTFEKFLILTGSGANGKSTILRIWRAVLGADNVSHVPLEGLSGEFRLADMVGKLANIAMDMQRMDRLEEGRLKEITSGEPIQINRKHKAPITTAITARLIFACNDLPQINDRSSGVWRRMIAMPFFASFRGEQADRLRGARLRQELAGIFNWSLAGAVRLYQQGAFTGCAVCDPTRSRAPAGVGSGGTVLRRMRRVPSRVGDSDWGLYAAYQDFCDGNGRSPKNSADFGKQVLMRPGVERRRRGDRQRQYEHIGVGLREGLSQPGGQRRIQPRSRPARAWR